ncbi:MAG TPA: hypothetical protein VHM16_08780 [Rubrobacteraceae bacterium]|nr:hypothetical protein [Rubrobacteraceae bacterium]
MDAGSEFGRRRDRRRARRRTVSFVMLTVFAVVIVTSVLFLVRGCGPESLGEEDSRSSAERAEKNKAATGETDPNDANPDEAEKKKRKPEKPFAALAPPDGAKPLSENLAGGEGVDMFALQDPQAGAAGGAGEVQYEDTGAEKTTKDGGKNDQKNSEAERRSVPVGEMVLSGKQDESDGPLKENRLVAYYGHPSTGLMGVLGEYQPDELMDRLKDQTAEYSKLDPDRPAVPTIELIASVAQPVPGADGLYVTQTPKKDIQTYVDLTKKNDALLLLDVQLGRATVMQEIKLLEPYLKLPHVHLAIDTEYSVEDGEVPGQDLGEVDGPEIQEAVGYLDDLVERENIPDKLLMVHQFEDGIVTNKQKIKPTKNVQVALHADGFGGADAKAVKYELLVRDQPIQYGGFKVFYKQDEPVLAPRDVLRLDPAPAVVTYQ